MTILLNISFILSYSLKYGRYVLGQQQDLHHNHIWGHAVKPHLLIQPLAALSSASVASSNTLPSFILTSPIATGYAHLDHRLHSMAETIEHRILRSQKARIVDLPEFPFTTRPVQTLTDVWTNMPHLLSLSTLKVRKIFFEMSQIVKGRNMVGNR